MPLAAFITLFFLCQRYPWEETCVGLILRALCPWRQVLSTGQFRTGLFGRWAQGPGNWSKPLVVHMAVDGAGAAGLGMAPVAELVSGKRPSASLLLLPGSAAPLALGPAEPVFLSCVPLPSATGRPVLLQHPRAAWQPFEMKQPSQTWKLLDLGVISFFQIPSPTSLQHRCKNSGFKTIFQGKLSSLR